MNAHMVALSMQAIEAFFWAAGSEVVGVMPAVNERWLCDEIAFFAASWQLHICMVAGVTNLRFCFQKPLAFLKWHSQGYMPICNH